MLLDRRSRYWAGSVAALRAESRGGHSGRVTLPSLRSSGPGPVLINDHQGRVIGGLTGKIV